MSGFEVVGVVSAAIAFITTARKICEAVKDTSGLNSELRTNLPQLALADDILTSVRAHGNALQDAPVDQAVMAALDICKKRSEALKEIFQKIGKTGGESPLEQLSKGFRAAKPGRNSKVQKLMKDIMDTLHIMHLHRMFQDDASAQKLEAARKELFKLGSDEDNSRITIHGDGVNVDSEDIKQQFGNHNSQTNYNSGGGNLSFDQRGLQILCIDNAYFKGCTFSKSHTRFPMTSSSNGFGQTLLERGPSNSGKLTRKVNAKSLHPLDTVLANIATYSKSMSQSKAGKQAMQLAAQVTVFLDAIQKVNQRRFVPDIVDRQIRRLKAQLKQTTGVKINEARQQCQPTRLSAARSEVLSVTFEHLQICLVTKTLDSRLSDGSPVTQTCSTLHVQPLGVSAPPRVSIFFVEETDCDRTVWLHPNILAYNEVSCHAKVFDLVRRDDLNGFKELLQIGEASLRDCDREGRTLILHACRYGSARICKFLIEYGSDVDRFARGFDSWIASNPLGTSCDSGGVAMTTDSEPFLDCTKLLLRAGADPTASFWSHGIDAMTGDEIEIRTFTPLTNCINHKTLEMFDVILSEGSAFIEWHREEDDYRSLWQDMLGVLAGSDSPISSVSAMLDRGLGAEFAITDKNGWNALFRQVMIAKSPRAGEELGTIRMLVAALDDIFAQDHDGFTLFERAGTERPKRSWIDETGTDSGDSRVNGSGDDEDDDHDYDDYDDHDGGDGDGDDDGSRQNVQTESRWYEDSPEIHGSYQQDLLYCALLRSGLYTQHDIPPLPAGPTFTPEYTPQHYRALLYLDSWDMITDPQILNHPLLSQDPLCDKERELAPAFHDWNIMDLSTMQRRSEFATFVERVWACSSGDEWSNSSAEEESVELDNDRSDGLAEDDSREPRIEWSNNAVEEEEELQRSGSEWSDDSEGEGGVPVRG